MESKYIQIIGARENNLKNVSINIPKYKLIAITGMSGSGKSSFAIDILQKECQRQYLESMSMISDGLNKPRVDKIIGLSPSISIGQRVLSNNPRSTVGTYSEILTYLRILYAKLATRTCPTCGHLIPPTFEITEEIDFHEQQCPSCNTKLQPLKMSSFSFNKVDGACKTCLGLGEVTSVDYSLLINEDKTISEGGFYLWNSELFGEHYAKCLEKCASHYGFDFDVSKKIGDFNKLEKMVFYYGVDNQDFINMFPSVKKPKRVVDGYFEGVKTYIDKKIKESTTKKLNNPTINRALRKQVCPTCRGDKLGFDGLHATINEKTICEISKYSILELQVFMKKLIDTLSIVETKIVETIVYDIEKRIKNIIKINLGYLSIDRPISTLSGGENQRLRLTNILDSGLTGVLYILDEPTTGLHPEDTSTLLSAVKKLRDLGNTVIVIEHDMDFVRECDYVIDFGIGAGVHGGNIISYGSVADVSKNKYSVTAPFLIPNKHPISSSTLNIDNYLTIKDVNVHNLKSVSCKVPLGKLVSFVGLSGSGKSSFVINGIYDRIKNDTNASTSIDGLEHISQVIKIDQLPIGKQSRSNVATYSEVYTLIRELYASLPNAKKNKLKASNFSFNVKGSRCPKCEGLGVIPLDMQFLEDVEVICPVCNGQRFKKEVLSVTYKDKSISDILDATIIENIETFKDQKGIIKILNTLDEVGLGYLKLGQSTTTMSGGECQRLKLSKELSKGVDGHILYILDEPTTGLHPKDNIKLIQLLKKLVSKNNSVFVIEHCTQLIVASDYIIELGPGAGNLGGNIIAKGTPYDIINNKNSIIRRYL